jgi:hypothetical protein
VTSHSVGRDPGDDLKLVPLKMGDWQLHEKTKPGGDAKTK